MLPSFLWGSAYLPRLLISLDGLAANKLKVFYADCLRSPSFNGEDNGFAGHFENFRCLWDREEIREFWIPLHIIYKGNTKHGTGQENCGMSPSEARKGGGTCLTVVRKSILS